MADCHSGLQPVQGLGLLIPELILKLLKDPTHLMVLWLGVCAGRDEVIHAQFSGCTLAKINEQMDPKNDEWPKHEETRLYRVYTWQS